MRTLFFLLLSFALFSEQTLSIIKPDAVKENRIGEIESYLEAAGLRIVAAKMIQLNKKQAETFYIEHKDRSFYKNLVEFMTSGPIVVQVLQAEDAIALNRKVMGSTDPLKAAVGTIRHDIGRSVQQNAVHGSDSLESAKKEISFFFQPSEIFSR